MSVDLGGLQTGVSQQFLDDTQVSTSVEEVRGEAVAERVGRRGLVEVEQVAEFIVQVLDAEGATAVIERVRPQVLELCGRFPVYGP